MACPSPELLAALVEDRLDPREREDVLDHAAGCDDCRRTLLSLQPEPAVAARPRSTLRVRAASPSWIPWAAAAALALSIGGLLLFSSQTPAPIASAPAAPLRPEPLPERRAENPLPPAPESATPRTDQPAPRPEEPARSLPNLPNPPSQPEPLPGPVPPAPPTEPPSKAPSPTTVVAVATLDAADGDVFVLTSKGREPARVGQTILSGHGVECDGPRSAALLSYPDRTRLELAGETVVREMVERDGTKGRRLIVDKGTVKAEVSRQPAGLAMMFETPHGEARVLGTTLALHVEADPKKGTRLEVEEGKVELKNAAGRTVLVDGGHHAVAATGIPLAVKAFPKEETLLAFAFEDGKKPALVASGTIERGPGNRVCLMAEGEPGAGTTRIVFADGDRGLFTFQGDEVLSFDYWVDPQAASVNFHFWNRTQGKTPWGEVPKLVTGKWAHAAIRLADLVDQGARMKEGDWLVNLYLQGTGSPSRKFYVDNVVITRSRVLKPRSVETKK